MENIDYSSYIISSYAIALGSMAVYLFHTLKKHKRLKRELAKLKPKKSTRN